MRPVLRPGVHVLRRGADALQVGLDPARAVLLPMRGRPRDVERLLDGAEVRDPDADPLLRLLHHEGLLMDEAGLRSTTRHAAHAALAREAGDDAAALLARRGLGPVSCVGFGHPAGRALLPRLTDLLDQAGVTVAPADEGTCLLVGVGEPERELVDPLMRAGRPHALLRVVEGQGVVGPFVVPGVTACLRCTDAHASDTDPAWPLLLAQYTARSGRDRADGATEPVDPLLAAVGLAWLARDVATHLDGRRPTCWSATVTLAPGLAALETRAWLRHPGCACTWD